MAQDTENSDSDESPPPPPPSRRDPGVESLTGPPPKPRLRDPGIIMRTIEGKQIKSGEDDGGSNDADEK